LIETSARHFRLGQHGRSRQRRYQRLGNLARIAFERLGELQSDVAGVVAMTRLFGAFERYRGGTVLRKGLRERSGNQFGQVRAQVDRQSGHPRVSGARIIAGCAREARKAL
jgi:hypothetical protein